MVGRQIPALGATAAAERIARAKGHGSFQGAARRNLTNRLLAFSRQRPLAPKPIDAKCFVSATCEFLRRMGKPYRSKPHWRRGWGVRTPTSPVGERAGSSHSSTPATPCPEGGKVTIETANCYLDESYVSAIPEPVDVGRVRHDRGRGHRHGAWTHGGARVRTLLHDQGSRPGTGLGLS